MVRFFGSGTVGTGAGVSFPVGSMMLYGGTTSPPPAGWLLCDGQAVSRVTFVALFGVIGILYGAGDGSTTFNLPDFRTSQSFPRGATNDAGRGTTGGASGVTLTAGQSGLPAHSHMYTASGSAQTPGVTSGATLIGGATNGATTTTTGPDVANDSHENQPPFQDVNYIIHV